MKKVWIGLVAVLVVIAAGTAVVAADDGSGSFQHMLPFMKKVHPNVDETQLQEMHNACTANQSATQSMHNNQMHDQMMKQVTPDK